MTSDHIFNPGMYVRLPSPDEIRREDGAYRDFRIGQIVAIDTIALTATVSLQTHAPFQEPKIEQLECPLDRLERCHILPTTRFTVLQSDQQGSILAACDDTWHPGQCCYYYAQIGGQIQRISEFDIVVSSFRQDSSPYQQLQHYEFHNPIWKYNRDQLIEEYSELHNATFGIEDLVGSRVMLLPHQAEVITRVLSSIECRFMLADEVGLGKTIEACVILKSLLRREPDLKTLIIAPASLMQQWHNELNNKFWLDFAIARPGNNVPFHKDCPGVMISVEDLVTYDVYWEWICTRTWGLLIVDEAHHLHHDPRSYKRIQHLSRKIRRVLILTATPIQRYAQEYLHLLQLLDPARYEPMDHDTFQHILSAQHRVRQAIVYLQPSLTPDSFDVDEFQEEIESLVAHLGTDQTLTNLAKQVTSYAHDIDQVLESATEVVAYVSENYRIEGRIIRNRRASLQISMPSRALDQNYCYDPEPDEITALDELYSYIDFYLEHAGYDTPHLEYCRLLLHAAASSPHALLYLLEQREHHLKAPTQHTSPDPASLATLATPSDHRQEAQRIAQLFKAVPVITGENDALGNPLWYTRYWLEQTDQLLNTISKRDLSTMDPSHHRLVNVLLAVHRTIEEKPSAKIVLFTRWFETLSILLETLKRLYRRGAVAQFHAQMDQDALQQAVDQFQAEDDCQFLVCDELGGEGRNFQIADMIIHVDLPWTPAHIEQRIGRVDRLGRRGVVTSVVPYARDTLEHALFRIWNDAFHLFTRSMSGMEITLEGIQNELAQAITQSTRHGLESLIPTMVKRAAQLRDAVEEERYFEEGAINYRSREQFQKISERYRDGSRLRNAFLPWANLAGLTHRYNQLKDTVQFVPRDFKSKSMSNAKFLPPNMEEALRRSRNSRNPVIIGTFNRDKAVQREDLVFFAPSDDPWTDAIISNAMEADRGRCCAILRVIPDLEQDWQGFEFLYRLSIDPRPLYAAGYDPAHLFRAQGFLVATTHRMVVSIDGQIIGRSSPIYKALKRPYSKERDYHLGQRSDPGAQLQHFKARYPPDAWHTLLTRIKNIAESHIHEEYEFTNELAEEANQEFTQHAAGWRAARRWFQRETGEQLPMDDIAEYERISAILVEGIRHPIIKLESVCFWELQRDFSDD
jgi:superfamily II DNA or RNA helicase